MASRIIVFFLRKRQGSILREKWIMADESKEIKKERSETFHLIIGIFLMLMGSYFIIIKLINISNETSEYIFFSFTHSAIIWILVYAGYLFIKKETLAKELLLCTVPYASVAIILLLIIYVPALITQSVRILLIHDSSIYIPIGVLLLSSLVYTPFLIILLVFKKLPDFHKTEYKHKLLIAKLISLLSPGFGRIILGKYISGYIIYILYMILQNFLTICYMESTGKSIFGISDDLLMFFVRFFFWFIFWMIDSSYIFKFQNALENKISESDAIMKTPPIIDINQNLQGES
jgi:hypothetical protein